jgi:hypothetical protein
VMYRIVLAEKVQTQAGIRRIIVKKN